MPSPYRVMFFKPLENLKPLTILQPMGAMCLTAYLHEQMQDVEPRIVDMVVDDMSYEDFAVRFEEFSPDVPCVSGVTLASKCLRRTAEILIRKNTDLEKIRIGIEQARQRGIMCQAFFMLGFPTETPEEAKATEDFAVQSPLHAAHLSIVMAYQGTELAELARAVRQEHGEGVRGRVYHGRIHQPDGYEGSRGGCAPPSGAAPILVEPVEDSGVSACVSEQASAS